MDDVRQDTVMLSVQGPDNFRLEGSSSMGQISRDPEDLVRAAVGTHHQYPDGFALFLGTMFAPIEDRDAPGQGFTHKLGDIVTISSKRLGALVNRVGYSDVLEPWSFGAGHLMRNLAKRGLL
jgi:fumarylacetoacetate (FAA) hydrolase family protein